MVVEGAYSFLAQDGSIWDGAGFPSEGELWL